MTRILQRPMFRIGGSADGGITSGLSPQRGLVDQPGGYAGEKYRFFESDEDRKRRMEKLYPGIYDQEEKDPFGKDEKYYVKEDGSIGTIEVKKPKNVFEGSVMDFAAEEVEGPKFNMQIILDKEREKSEVLPYEEFDVDVDKVETGSLTDRADLLTEGDIGGPETQQEVMSSPEGLDSDMDIGLQRALFDQNIKLPKSTSGADFWLNLGTSILAQPGGRPILQTIGTAAKEPLARLQSQRSAEDRLKYQHAVGERQFALDVYQALNDEQKTAMQRNIKYLMTKEGGGLSLADATNRVANEFRKDMSPGQKTYEAEQTAKKDFDVQVNRLIDDNSDIQFKDQAEIVLEYRDNRQKWKDQKLEQDTNQIYMDTDDMNKNLTFNEEGTELTKTEGAQLDGEYLINKIYVDINTGKVYLWDGISFKQQSLNAPTISNSE